MSDAWEQAMAYARAETPDTGSAYLETDARKITRRGILWLGQICNLRNICDGKTVP